MDDSQFAQLFLAWLRRHAVDPSGVASDPSTTEGPTIPSTPSESMSINHPEDSSSLFVDLQQGLLFPSRGRYREEASTIGSDVELADALDHLEYVVYRRYRNHLTRAERARMDNAIMNASYKIERYLARMSGEEPAYAQSETRYQRARETLLAERQVHEAHQQRNVRLQRRLQTLDRLSAEAFEEFVAELFEAEGFDVERVGGTDDQGVDLRLNREAVHAIVQCKHHKKSLVGSPDLQRFLGALQQSRAVRGYFVTTTGFTLSAERFCLDHPIELIDGPNLVGWVEAILGPWRRRKHQEPRLWDQIEDDLHSQPT